MSFKKRLLDARKRKGISQDDLAKHLGTKGPVIGRYERYEIKPSIEVAAKMTGLFGYFPRLLGGENGCAARF
jgi:ribosome-binding protein aMBF1 (putative translation factor)